MKEIPSDLHYTGTHEWVKLEESGILTVGITNHAQHLLGDLVFVELPELETSHNGGDECGVVESVKAAADVYCPIAGEVIEVNAILEDKPGLINSDPYGDGWIFRLQPLDNDAYKQLMDADEYAEKITSEGV